MLTYSDTQDGPLMPREPTDSAAEQPTPLQETALELLVESVVDYAIFVLDADGRVQSWNPGAERIKGYRASEIVGRNYRVFYTPEAIAAHEPERELNLAAEHGRVEGEGWRVRKDGSRFWASNVLVALHDPQGRLVGFGKVTRDLTLRRQAEEDARRLAEEKAARQASEEARADAERARRSAEEARRRLTLLARSSELLATRLDYDETLAAAARIAVPGFADWAAVDVLEAGRIRRVAVAHADPAKAHYAWELRERWPMDPDAASGIPAVIRTGRTEFLPAITDDLLGSICADDEELRVVRELGPTAAITVSLRTSEGPAGALSLVLARTGGFEPEDVELAEELGFRAGLAVQNARLYREARQAAQMREEFVAVASHELRTPLAALSLQIDAMRRSLGRESARPDEFAARCRKAEVQVGRIDALISQLLDVGRIGAGRVELTRARMDLGTLAAEVIAHLDAQAKVELRRSGPVEGSWDRDRLEQLVTNLVSNAIKYGKGRPVTVSVEARDGVARLSVRDQGIGIDPKDQRRVFEKFERASSHNYGGFGLGLWIAREIAQLHGGRILLESHPGEGADFVVELPMKLG